MLGIGVEFIGGEFPSIVYRGVLCSSNKRRNYPYPLKLRQNPKIWII